MKIFFFYFFFPTAPRNGKKLPLTFFSEIPRKKVLKNPAKCAQVSFFTNYVFSAVITRTHTHTPTHTHSPFFGPIMRKKCA